MPQILLELLKDNLETNIDLNCKKKKCLVGS